MKNKSEQHLSPLESLQKFHDKTLQWLSNMLLYDEIRLKDIPYEVRTAGSSLYIAALRISNGLSCKRFIKELQVLCKDILMTSDNNPMKSEMIHILSEYLAINDHKGESDFVNFTNNIYEEVLQELRNHDEAVRQSLLDRITAYGNK